MIMLLLLSSEMEKRYGLNIYIKWEQQQSYGQRGTGQETN